MPTTIIKQQGHSWTLCRTVIEVSKLSSLWLRLEQAKYVPHQSPGALRAVGMRGGMEFFVDAKSLVQKRTKLKPCRVGRTGPRAQGVCLK